MEHRCEWCGDDPQYVDYHDNEWGVPDYDSRVLFENLMLDGFQAGLSWLTILRKRENFQTAFDGFDPDKIALWEESKIQELLNNSGIVRHRGKIEAAIGNARAWQAIEADQGFGNFFWDYVDGKPLQNNFRSMAEVPTKTELSAQLSKDLKKAGFKFCGPVIIYAFMQAVGMVNDHMVACPCHKKVQALAR